MLRFLKMVVCGTAKERNLFRHQPFRRPETDRPDAIVVMDRSPIVETGSHEQLLPAKSGTMTCT